MRFFQSRVTFDLVAVNAKIVVSDGDWKKIQFQLLEFQPASRVRLLGDPSDRIRVWSYGNHADVAPGILSRVEELAGVSLTLKSRRR